MLVTMRTYFVYIMASRSRVLYTGVTNDLERRVLEHKRGLNRGFTSRYRVTRLVYYEVFTDIRMAIAREKQIKSWNREKRVRLIERGNPLWIDFALPLPTHRDPHRQG
jgi:putative endonuclease